MKILFASFLIIFGCFHSYLFAFSTLRSKNKAKSLDSKLAKWTKWVSIAWVVITLALSLIP